MLCSGLADLQDQQGDSGKTGTLDLSAGTWRQLGGLEDKPPSTAMAPGGSVGTQGLVWAPERLCWALSGTCERHLMAPPCRSPSGLGYPCPSSEKRQQASRAGSRLTQQRAPGGSSVAAEPGGRTGHARGGTDEGGATRPGPSRHPRVQGQ